MLRDQTADPLGGGLTAGRAEKKVSEKLEQS
jgi:hypothetical protein